MKSAEADILSELSSEAAESAGLVRNLIAGQLSLIEKKVIIARHFSTVNGSCVDTDIQELARNKDALEQDVTVAVNKVSQALGFINKGVERIDELERAITNIAAKMAKTVAAEEPVDVSELENLLIDYENDNIFQYFKKKSNLSDSTSLSTGLNGLDKFVARVTGYDTALENFKVISSEIQRRNSLPKKRSVSAAMVRPREDQEDISIKRQKLKDAHDYMRESLPKFERLWLALLSKVTTARGEIENLDRELACVVAREMSISSVRAGGVGNVKVPIMDEHDKLLAKVVGSANLFDKLSERTTLRMQIFRSEKTSS